MSLVLLALPLVVPALVAATIAAWRSWRNRNTEATQERCRRIKEGLAAWLGREIAGAVAGLTLLVVVGLVAWFTRARWWPVVARGAASLRRVLWLVV